MQTACYLQLQTTAQVLHQSRKSIAAYSLVERSAHQSSCQLVQVLPAQAVACLPDSAHIECLSWQPNENAQDAHLIILRVCARMEKLGQCLELLVHRECVRQINSLTARVNGVSFFD